jgi:hypothetical protein
MNERHPKINEASPGQPYFVAEKPPREGQWVRLVVRTKEWVRAGDSWDDHFVFVGTLDRAVDDDHILVRDVALESEAPAWLEGKWIALIGRREKGEARWVIESFEKETKTATPKRSKKKRVAKAPRRRSKSR